MNILSAKELSRTMVFDQLMLPDLSDLLTAHAADLPVLLAMQNRVVWRVISANHAEVAALAADQQRPDIAKRVMAGYSQARQQGLPTTTLADYMAFASAFYLGCAALASDQSHQAIEVVRYQLSDEYEIEPDVSALASNLAEQLNRLASAVKGLESFGYTQDAQRYQQTLKVLCDQAHSLGHESGEYAALFDELVGQANQSLKPTIASIRVPSGLHSLPVFDRVRRQATS